MNGAITFVEFLVSSQRMDIRSSSHQLEIISSGSGSCSHIGTYALVTWNYFEFKFARFLIAYLELLPREIWQSGHRWCATLHPSTQKGMRQQPKSHPIQQRQIHAPTVNIPGSVVTVDRTSLLHEWQKHRVGCLPKWTWVAPCLPTCPAGTTNPWTGAGCSGTGVASTRWITFDFTADSSSGILTTVA